MTGELHIYQMIDSQRRMDRKGCHNKTRLERSNITVTHNSSGMLIPIFLIPYMRMNGSFPRNIPPSERRLTIKNIFLKPLIYHLSNKHLSDIPGSVYGNDSSRHP